MGADRIQSGQNGGDNKSQVGAVLIVKYYNESHDPVRTAIVDLVNNSNPDVMHAGLEFFAAIRSMLLGGTVAGNEWTNGLPTPLPPYVRLRYVEDATGAYRLYLSEQFSSGTGYTQEVRILRVSHFSEPVHQCLQDCCDRHPLAY